MKSRQPKSSQTINNKTNFKSLCLLVFAIIISLNTFSQGWQWVTELGSPVAKKIVKDGSGNTFVSADFTLSNTIGTQTVTATYRGIYISKLDVSGTPLWTKALNQGNYYDLFLDNIYSDQSGNVYVTANFQNAVIIENDTLQGSGFAHDAVMVKYDSNGNYLWSTLIKGTSAQNSYYCYIQDVVTNSTGELYITGWAYNTNPTVNGSSISVGAYIIKLNPTNGNLINHYPLQDANSSLVKPFNIGVDNSGNLYVSGRHSVSAKMNNTTFNDDNYFLGKLTSGGTWSWLKSFGSVNLDEVIDMEVTQSGDIYLAGLYIVKFFYDSDSLVNFNTTSQYDDIFLLLVNSSGTLQWKKTYGGDTDDPFMGISLRNNNNLLLFASAASDTITVEGTSVPKGNYFILDMQVSGTAASVNAYTTNVIGGVGTVGDITDNNGAITICGSAPPSAQFGNITTSPSWKGFAASQGTSTGISNIESSNLDFQVYPNPANDFITISNIPVGSSIKIFDVTGKIIWNTSESTQKISINTSAFTNGIYTVYIINNKIMAAKKIVINR